MSEQPPYDPDDYELDAGTRRQPPEPGDVPLSDTQKISEIAASWNRATPRHPQDAVYGEPFPGETGARRRDDVYGYSPRRRPSRRRNLLGACLALSGAFFAFGVVAVIVAAILAPSIYRSQRPEMQEIWCNRAERVGASFVCDWKPTPPAEFAPPVVGTPIEDPFAILTPPRQPHLAGQADSAGDTGSAGENPAATQGRASSSPPRHRLRQPPRSRQPSRRLSPRRQPLPICPPRRPFRVRCLTNSIPHGCTITPRPGTTAARLPYRWA